MNLSSEELQLYNRHLLLEKIGIEGQLKLKNARVLVIGAGGLGCPVLLYLAGAGVGNIGIVDFDVVDISNLHRQVLYTTEDVGRPKAMQAAMHLIKRNPYVNIRPINEKLTVENTLTIFSEYDIIIDGTDNFETRYMINDACVLLNKTLIYGAVLKFAGQVSVFNHLLQNGKRSATYRCLFPKSPDNDGMSCSEVGVLGVMPGIIGTLQAAETIKIITDIGSSLENKLLMIDTAAMSFTTYDLERAESSWGDCPSSAQAFSTFNYEYFCRTTVKISKLSVTRFHQKLLENINLLVLDVRDSNDLPALTFNNCINIPLKLLEDRIREINQNLDVVVVCTSGKRSELAVKMLQAKGLTKIWNLEGGVNAWQKFKVEDQYAGG